MIMIYYRDKRNGSHLKHVRKNASFKLETYISDFLKLFLYQFPGHAIFF